MDISVKDDARQRIEKVVKEYRETQGKHNFTWEVQKRFVIDENILIFLALGSAISGAALYMEQAENIKLPLWGLIVFTVLTIAFQFICRLSNRFKEKVWTGDFIIDKDILYLCENSELKQNLRDDIANLGRVTYSFVLNKIPVYLGEIEYRQRQAARDVLLKKIDETDADTNA